MNDAQRQRARTLLAELQSLLDGGGDTLTLAVDVPKVDPVEALFNECWELYPPQRRDRKAEALIAFRGIAKLPKQDRPTREQLLTATRNYAAVCQRDKVEKQFIMHAATFYGATKKRYADYITANSTSPVQGESRMYMTSPEMVAAQEMMRRGEL